MRKALAVLIMISVCSIYFIAMKNKGVEEASTEKTTFLKAHTEMEKQIEQITEEINKEYPKTPKLLIETANEIMRLQYSKEWEPESKIESQTLSALRLLYSKELLELNSYEEQLEALEIELNQNDKQDLYLEEVRIESIKFETTDHALVKVLNKTSKGMQQREYTLIKEEGLWKIYRWTDLNQ